MLRLAGKRGKARLGRGNSSRPEPDHSAEWEIGITQRLEHMGVIDGLAMGGEIDVAPAFQGREQHERRGGAIALVCMSAS